MGRANDLQVAVENELVNLWTDLQSAQRRAIPPGSKSMECEWIEGRIRTLTELVDPPNWEQIPMTFLAQFEELHRQWGIDIDPIDWETVASLSTR